MQGNVDGAEIRVLESRRAVPGSVASRIPLDIARIRRRRHPNLAPDPAGIATDPEIRHLGVDDVLDRRRLRRHDAQRPGGDRQVHYCARSALHVSSSRLPGSAIAKVQSTLTWERAIFNAGRALRPRSCENALS